MSEYLFTDFSAGQLSRKLAGRFDLPIYAKGVAKAKNWIPTIPCGITTRPGTRHVGGTGASANINWVISKTIAYRVELLSLGGHGIFQFYRDDVNVFTLDTSIDLSYTDAESVAWTQSPNRLYLVFGTGVCAPQVIIYTAPDTFTIETLAIMGNTGNVPFQSANNYPKKIAMHDQCLVFANTINEPSKLWRSRPGIFYYEPWQAEADYEVGALRTSPDPTKLAIFQCTTAGRSGTTEPTWPSSGTVTDGTVVWTFYASYRVDFSEYTEVIITTWPLRPTAITFMGDIADDSQTIENINEKVFNAVKIGDRITGEGTRNRSALAFVGTLASTSTISGVPTGIGDQLLEGEALLSDSTTIPVHVTDYSGGTITFSPAGGLGGSTGSAISVRTGEIITYITQKETSPSNYIVAIAHSVIDLGVYGLGTYQLGDYYFTLDKTQANLMAGWHDPLVQESEILITRTKTVTASHAFSAAIASGQAGEILWLASGRDLIIGTDSGEHVMPSGTTALSIQAPRVTSHGSAEVAPIVLGESVIFVERSGKALREYVYSQERDGYWSPPLSASAEDIFTGTIKKLVYQTSPVPIIWALQDNGTDNNTVVGCTFAPALGITGFFTLETAGDIDDIIVLPFNGIETLYLMLYPDDIAGHWAERLLPIETPGEHLDASAQKTVASGKVTGLTQLASTTATVYYLGHSYEVAVTAGGEATMPAAVPNGASVVVGIPFESVLTLLPPNPRGKYMTSKTTFSAIFRVLASYPFKIATSETAADETAAITGPFSGDIEVPLIGNWETQGAITIIQDEPFDTTIIAVMAESDAGGR